MFSTGRSVHVHWTMSASAAEASSLAATGRSNVRSDGRVCTIRPGVNLENTVLPVPLKAGDAGRAFYYLLESAAGYLHISNGSMALVKLKEAEVLRKTKAIVTAHFEEATFFSLKGEVCCCMNHIKLAKKMIREALSLLERHFPWSSFAALIKSQVEKLPCATFVRRAASLPQEIR
ncbi:adenylate cyclase type 10 [Limosa lapponica baueri]|uniref:Adenylate cyclase type 10 n=1 Tax=Limosa lapponica baueri TaxID=1758121 RepID=A0A2I0T3X1_LIMLA|nr:adenylate cyclase type 10 [Limosa lapponica baueri]